MVLDKRGELMAYERSGLVKDSTSVAIGPPSDDLGPAELDSGVHATSTGTQAVVKTGAGNLQLRGSTSTW